MSTQLDLSPKSDVSPKSMGAAASPLPVVDIRYGQIGLVQLRIRSTDTGELLDELTGRIATAPNFFRRTAVCIEVSDLERTPDAAELQGVLNAVKRAGMLSVGFAGGSPELEAVAASLNLPILSAFRPSTFPGAKAAPIAQPVAVEAPAPPPADPTLSAMMQHQTIRSGQRVYARHRDLVITAGVGAGAEVIADGCIHIYGALRGRAMAGAHGQTGARIFCQEFQAELVSISGVFRVFETIPKELAGKPVQAWLDGEHLHFARVGV